MKTRLGIYAFIAIAAVWLVGAQRLHAEVPTAAPASQFAVVSSDGVKLHYLTAGHGPLVVLLHGYAQTSHMWLPLMAALSQTHTVVAPDLRGAGESDTPTSGYTKKNMAQDIHALVQKLGHGRTSLVGHDIGLMVAYAYAAQFPSEVERVVLMDAFLPGVGDYQGVFLLQDKWHFHFFGETPEKLVQGRERIYLDHFWNDFAADRTHSVSEADRELYTRAYAAPGHMRAGFEYFKAFPEDNRDFAQLAKTKLALPMLVLTGEKASGAFLIDQARLVDDHVEGFVVPGKGHWLMEEARDVVVPRIVAFLNAARGS